MNVQTELLPEPQNVCRFSPCEEYRYTLIHSWDKVGEKFVQRMPVEAEKRIMWIGLNPSTADTRQLDPTLRRVRWFSHEWGFRSFVMTNLFAYRATLPRKMLLQSDPIGLYNNAMLIEMAANSQMVIACWGNHGSHLGRDATVRRILTCPFYCLGLNRDGSPRHPLYVPGIQKPLLYAP